MPGVQTFATPHPPQVSPCAQLPQINLPPQPSGMEPQFLPCVSQVVFTHAHWPSTHEPALQVPHISEPPQPSAMEPHTLPCASHVIGAQVHAPSLQTRSARQVGQLSVPPQPSGQLPQALPSESQVAGVQKQWSEAQSERPESETRTSGAFAASLSMTSVAPCAPSVAGGTNVT